MNVLMIGSDYTLAMDREGIIGDTQDRHILYGKYVSNLFIVVASPKRMRLGVKRLSQNVIVYPTSSRKFLSSWDAYRIGKNIYRHNKIDVIATQDPFLAGLVGYWLKRRLHIPLNIQIHADFLDNKYWIQESMKNRFFNQLGKWIAKRADTVRVVSSTIRERLASYDISNDRIWFYPVQPSTGKFVRYSAAEVAKIKEEYLPNGGTILLCVGALRKQKNYPNLLRAASIVTGRKPSARFLICGDGTERRDLEKQAYRLGIEKNVLFLGDIPHDYLTHYYHSCDIFVLPSNYEGFARVLSEAAAAEKPIITTNVSGAVDIVKDSETGFLIALDNPTELAEKIIWMIDRPEIARKMGENGYRHVMQFFDNARILSEMVDMWKYTARLGK